MRVARAAAGPDRTARGPANEHCWTDGVKRRSRGGCAPRAQAGPAEGRSFSKRSAGVGVDPSELIILDGDGRILVVNQAWRQTVAACGFALRNAGIGASYVEVAREFLPDLYLAGLEFSLQRLLAGAVDDVRLTFAVQTPGGPRWRQVQITPLSVGGSGRFVAIHDDQTELATTREALRLTSEQLLTARDEERQRIAVELHDAMSQHLCAIGMSLTRLQRASPNGGQETAALDEMSRSLDTVFKEMRVLSYLMKPRELAQNSLSVAVRQFLKGFAGRTDLEVVLEADEAVDGVPAPLQHAALRIVQEALMNANRHAQAHRVSVELAISDGLLKVSVVDDGRGMRSDQGDACLGVGIPGMRARAQQVSGALTISSDESGTRVEALLPLP